MSRRPRWLGWSDRADLALALGLCALAQFEVVVYRETRVSHIAAAVCTLPLAVRRRAPLVAAFAVFAAPVIDRALGGTWELPWALAAAAVVASYSVAAYQRWPRAVVGGLLVLAGMWLSVRWTAPPETGFSGPAMVLVVPWLAG